MSSSSSVNFLLAAFVALSIIIAFASAQDIYGSQGEKRNFNREFMHFGKRGSSSNNGEFQLFRPLSVGVYDKRASEFDRNFMPFGKRFSGDYEPLMEKKQFNREFMHFGKRSAPSVPFQVYPDGWPIVLIRL